MKSSNEVRTEVEHLDNLARETNDVSYGRAAIALLDELSQRQTGEMRWSTLSFALRLRLSWTPDDPAIDSFFTRFVREVEEAPHANIVEKKLARRKIHGALHGALTVAMKDWLSTTAFSARS